MKKFIYSIVKTNKKVWGKKSVYGKYINQKSVTSAAYKTLLDYNLTVFPNNLLQITKAEKIRVLQNSKARLLAEGVYASSYFDGKWYIVYDDTLSRQMYRLVIAQELGRIFLGHPMYCNGFGYSFIQTPFGNEQAAKFAIELLVPTCLFCNMKNKRVNNLVKYFNISKELAKVSIARFLDAFISDKPLCEGDEAYELINNARYKSRRRNRKIQRVIGNATSIIRKRQDVAIYNHS